MTKSNRAFTVMELLVVMAVIVILAALLLPTLARSRQRAQQIRCASNLHQIGLGLQNFVADNHAYPTIYSPTNSEQSGTWGRQIERGGFDLEVKSNALAEGVWHCPSVQFKNPPTNFVRASYGYNAYGAVRKATNSLGLTGNIFVQSRASISFTRVNESEVVNPSDMMAIGDSMNGVIEFWRLPAYLKPGGLADLRHQGRLNVVFCDAHVESPTLEFLFANTNDAALCRWNRDHQPHRERL